MQPGELAIPRQSLTIIAFCAALAASLLLGQAVRAGENSADLAGHWKKKGYDFRGTWKIVSAKGHRYLVLGDDFKTRSGPDLKLFLSPKTFAKVGDNNATSGSVRVGVLKKPSGTQQYQIPDSVNLASFNSVIIHCERYSKLWGGSPLRPGG